MSFYFTALSPAPILHLSILIFLITLYHFLYFSFIHYLFSLSLFPYLNPRIIFLSYPLSLVLYMLMFYNKFFPYHHSALLINISILSAWILFPIFYFFSQALTLFSFQHPCNTSEYLLRHFSLFILTLSFVFPLLP